MAKAITRMRMGTCSGKANERLVVMKNLQTERGKVTYYNTDSKAGHDVATWDINFTRDVVNRF
jgi:pyridoxine/pyridoxamine 5'-phosphate oxidase